MTWTNEKPTVAGWYWHRDHYGNRVIEVRESGYNSEPGLVIIDPEFSHGETCIATTLGQFAGPIPKPEEAPE
jgi:hypothetical protein